MTPQGQGEIGGKLGGGEEAEEEGSCMAEISVVGG
jgi:hypothetical protein